MNRSSGTFARRLSSAVPALAVLGATFAAPAHAYVGPGAGLGVIGTLFGIVAAIVLAMFGLLWYPLKRAFGKKGAAGGAPASEAAGGTAPAAGTAPVNTSSAGAVSAAAAPTEPAVARTGTPIAADAERHESSSPGNGGAR